MIPKWEKFPENMKKNFYVKEHYDCLLTKKKYLLIKRMFDVLIWFLLIYILFDIMVIIGIIIKCTSKGPVLYKQERITQYGKKFYIYKFRTMEENSENSGSITCANDPRVTSFGRFLRKFRIDEWPQLLNVLVGDMTFVGTRPEIQKYVDKYNDEMMATLVLPAGVTSLASIEFRDEENFFQDRENIDKIYMEEVLPKKMEYNIFNFM